MSDDFSPARDAVAAQLADLSAPDAPLNTDSRHNTTQLYAASVQRRVFRKTVIDQYLDSAPTPPREGRSALITAGPPGQVNPPCSASRSRTCRTIDASTPTRSKTI